MKCSERMPYWTDLGLEQIEELWHDVAWTASDFVSQVAASGTRYPTEKTLAPSTGETKE